MPGLALIVVSKECSMVAWTAFRSCTQDFQLPGSLLYCCCPACRAVMRLERSQTHSFAYRRSRLSGSAGQQSHSASHETNFEKRNAAPTKYNILRAWEIGTTLATQMVSIEKELWQEDYSGFQSQKHSERSLHQCHRKLGATGHRTPAKICDPCTWLPGTLLQLQRTTAEFDTLPKSQFILIFAPRKTKSKRRALTINWYTIKWNRSGQSPFCNRCSLASLQALSGPETPKGEPFSGCDCWAQACCKTWVLDSWTNEANESCMRETEVDTASR